MARTNARKSSKVVFEQVLEASTLSLAEVDKLAPVLVDAVACMLWGERWNERHQQANKRETWKLWKRQDESVRDCWHDVARRSLSLLFGLKIPRPDTMRRVRSA